MPPAISDDEASNISDEVAAPAPPKRGRRAGHEANEEDMRSPVRADINNGAESAASSDDDDDEEAEDDMDEDEYIVEKILSHRVDNKKGTVTYEVKWEGYEAEADRTWEASENLRENASEALEEYLASVGGEDKIVSDSRLAVRTKKRGRPSAQAPAPSSSTPKRRRNGEHPASTTPPTSSKQWKPPVGSWEEDVESIDACQDEHSSKLIVYLTWKNGQKTQHDTKVIYQRCPQKMLKFYETHVKIVKTMSGAS